MAENRRRHKRILKVTQQGQHGFDIVAYTGRPTGGSSDRGRSLISTIALLLLGITTLVT